LGRYEQSITIDTILAGSAINQVIIDSLKQAPREPPIDRRLSPTLD
jgi:hypothetical protein